MTSAQPDIPQPIQYREGVAHFYGLDLSVGPGAFIPRFETEVMVEYALAHVTDPHWVVDLCSGPGTIALKLATEFAGAEVWAVEKSSEAFTYLERNVFRLAPQVESVLGDATSAELLGQLEGQVDLVVSNPPYVHPDDQVAVDVLAHEPHLALFGQGVDGLEIPRGVAVTAARLLRPGGLFLCELSPTNINVFAAWLVDIGWQRVEVHRDLPGRNRFISARK